MDTLPTAVTTIPPKRREHGRYPALLFDKQSIDSDLTEILTIREVAKTLKISEVSVRRLQHGQIPYFKIGGSVRFARRDVLAFLEKCRVEAIDL